MVMMPITGSLIGPVQPKYLIATGAAIAALSMWHLTGINGDITYGYAAMSRIYPGDRTALPVPSHHHRIL